MKRLRLEHLLLVGICFVAACGGGGTPTPTPIPTIGPPPAPPGATEMADRYYDALNLGNVGEVVALLDQDVVMLVGTTQIVGKADVVARHLHAFASFADYSYSGPVVEGNTFRATHQYKVDPARETGEFPLVSGQIEIVVRDGKITLITVVLEERPQGPATSGPTPSPTSEGATSTAASVPTSAPGADRRDIETIRRLAFDYWAAFNDYDTEKVLSYLEDSYRAEREGELGEDIGRIKLFRVKLGVSQLTPPRLTGAGEGEMMLLMQEPLGTRQIRMAFRKIDGEWKITNAEEE